MGRASEQRYTVITTDKEGTKMQSVIEQSLGLSQMWINQRKTQLKVILLM